MEEMIYKRTVEQLFATKDMKVVAFTQNKENFIAWKKNSQQNRN